MIDFYPKGTKVEYLGWIRSSWDKEIAASWDKETAASAAIKISDVLTVKSCRIGGFSSSYKFEEVEGEFNSVMFNEVGKCDHVWESLEFKFNNQKCNECINCGTRKAYD